MLRTFCFKEKTRNQDNGRERERERSTRGEIEGRRERERGRETDGGRERIQSWGGSRRRDAVFEGPGAKGKARKRLIDV